MKKQEKMGVKKLQLKKSTIYQFETHKISNAKALKGGEEELAHSLAQFCTLTRPTYSKP
jgi:hypothetical protein